MSKHRKRPEEKKKKVTKGQLIIAPILVGVSVGIALVINILITGPPPLEQCITSEGDSSTDTKYTFHQHAYLNVTLDGVSFTVPANIGITSDCIRPLHTTDSSGTIHSEFVKPVKFTLGNFIKLWGLNLDQYDVKILVKDSADVDLREVNVSEINTLFLRDGMRITIELTSR